MQNGSKQANLVDWPYRVAAGLPQRWLGRFLGKGVLGVHPTQRMRSIETAPFPIRNALLNQGRRS